MKGVWGAGWLTAWVIGAGWDRAATQQGRQARPPSSAGAKTRARYGLRAGEPRRWECLLLPEADSQPRSRREPKADVREMGEGRIGRDLSPLWDSGSLAQPGPLANPAPEVLRYRN